MKSAGEADNSVNSVSADIFDKKRFSQMSQKAFMLSEKYSWDAIAIKSHSEYLKLLKKV